MIPSQQSKSTSHRLLAVVAVLFLSAPPLHAHHLPPGMEDVDEFENEAAFVAGLRHPLLGWDHCLLALAVGAAAFSTTRRHRLLVPALIVSVAVSGFAKLQGWLPLATTWSELVAISATLLLIASRNRLPPSAQTAIVCAAGVLQGIDHALSWPLDSAVPAYMLGIAATTLLLACGGAVVASVTRLAILTSKAPASAAC